MPQHAEQPLPLSLSTSSESGPEPRPFLLLAAGLLVGAAVKLNGGNYHPVAVARVCLALAAAGAALVWPARVRRSEATSPWPLAAAAAAAVLAQLVMVFAGRVVPPSEEAGPVWPVLGLLVACAAGVGPAVAWAAAPGPSRETAWAIVARVAFPLALVAHLAAGVAATVASPSPVFDVIVFQTLGGARLLEGGNPYGMTFPDLSAGTSPHYGPGLQAGGQLLFGFPYPPLSLLCLLPVQLFGGDYRLATAAAFTAAGGLIGYCRPGPWAKVAAGLFLLTPIGPLIVAGGWTEPLAALMLAGTVFVACRWGPRAAEAGKAKVEGGGWGTGVMLGLWWAIKQYVPLAAPLALLLIPRRAATTDGGAVERSPTREGGVGAAGGVASEAQPHPSGWGSFGDRGNRVALARLLVAAIVAGAVVTLPLVLWDVRAFWHSAVAVQLRQPFRPDALSLSAALYAATGVPLPAWAAFVGLAAVQALALWRAPRTPAGFAAATGVGLLAFFALSKQAFANYYFLTIAALACAAAAIDDPTADPRPGAPGPRRTNPAAASPSSPGRTRSTPSRRRTRA